MNEFIKINMGSNYKYQNKKGLININTLSPSGSFFYRIKKPISINMTNFACRIAFFDTSENFIYYRHDVLAHWLEPWQKIEVVKWSLQGNVAYIYEYQRNKIYESVFLHLKDRCCIRIDESKDNFHLVKRFSLVDRQFDETEILKELHSLGFHNQKLFKDKIPSNTISNLLGFNKWHPK